MEGLPPVHSGEGGPEERGPEESGARGTGAWLRTWGLDQIVGAARRHAKNCGGDGQWSWTAEAVTTSGGRTAKAVSTSGGRTAEAVTTNGGRTARAVATNGGRTAEAVTRAGNYYRWEDG
jgi:hypothetical protein